LEVTVSRKPEGDIATLIAGPKDIFANKLVAACAMAACLGGLLFGL
jgi:hypothetical protein